MKHRGVSAFRDTKNTKKQRTLLPAGLIFLKNWVQDTFVKVKFLFLSCFCL
jgi:hypothetical protein